MEVDGNLSSESASADEALRRLALHLAGREADAEDLAQEVKLSALRKPGLLEREWFRIVARRTLWRWSYRDRARVVRERRVARPEAQDGGLGELEAASLREFLSASVSALKEPYREVIRLHYFEDLPVEEIGRRLERPSVTVRVQLSRGLELLRTRLEGRRERFLTLAPLVSTWSELRRRWMRHANKRAVALGAVAAVFAVTLLFVVAGRADRSREASATSPEVAGVSGASLLAPETRALAERRPIAGDAPVRAAPASPFARLSGRVLSFDGRPLAGAPVFLRDRSGKSHAAAVSDGEGRYEVVSADLEDWIEARPAGSLPTPPHLVCSVERGRELDLVTARPAGSLRGRVRDAEGRAVSGAEVVLKSPLMTSRVGSLLATTVRDELSERASFGGQATVEGSPEPTRCFTDASGRFEALKPPEKKFLVLVHAPGLPPWLELREAQAGDEELEIELAVPASIAGRVLDQGGRPCGGARLEVSFPEPRPRLEVLTDEAGRFEFAGLGSGPFALRLLERPSGTASCHVEGRIVDGQHLQLDLELSQESSIAGTVAADGRPLGGWNVLLWELVDRDFPGRDDRETRTASDGSFAFLGCSDKEYDLEFFDPDSPARRHRVTTRAGRSPLTLEPRPSELVLFRGRIVVGGGAPRPSLLSIAAVRGSLVGRQTLVTIADESDEFRGPYLLRGTYNVDAFFPGSPAPWRKTLELDEHESILAIPRRGSLRVVLELPADASLDGAAAFVRVRAPLATYWMHAPMRRDPGDDAFVAELMPGTYWVIVTLDGYAAEYTKAKVEEARETQLSMTPRKGTAVTIQVVAPRPLGDGEVLRLEVEETARRVPVPFFREALGERNTWWAGVELSADARRIVSFTPGGLSGELALTAELLQPGAVLRVDLAERGSAR